MRAKPTKKLYQKAKKIQGWFDPEVALLFAWIDEIQKTIGCVGDVFEIGVHHGKSAIFLGSFLDPACEQLGVCDLFEHQELNVSGSGLGDQQIFEQNMSTHLKEHGNIRIFAQSSAQLSPAEIGSNYRFFHIDGGHNADEVLNDLRLAADSILPEGVIAMDDAIAPNFPGVVEGIIHFLTEQHTFCAIAIGFNKMILTRCNAADLYTSEFDKADQRLDYGLGYPFHYKTLPFINHPLRIFHIPSFVNPDSIGVKLRKRYQHSEWAKQPWIQAMVSGLKKIIR